MWWAIFPLPSQFNQGQLISSVSSMLTEGMEPSEIQNGLNSMAEFIQTPSLEFLFLGTDLVFQLLTFLGVAVLIGIFLNRKAKTSMFKLSAFSLIFGILLCSTCNRSHRKRCYLRDYLHCYCCTLPCCCMDRIKNLYARWSWKFLGKPDPTRKNGGPKNQPPHKMPKIVMPKD